MSFNQAVSTPNEMVNFYLTYNEGRRHADYMCPHRMRQIIEMLSASRQLSTQAKEKCDVYLGHAQKAAA